MITESLSLSFPKEDTRQFFRALDRMQKDLGIKDVGAALKIGTTQLIKTLAASTRVAPKYRKVTAAPSPRSARFKNFEVDGYFGNPREKGTRIVRARTKMNAKRRHGAIRNRGLAKNTWRIAGKAIYSDLQVERFAASGRTQQIARRSVNTRKRLKGDDAFVSITNKLPYIMDAMQGGDRPVSTAMDRASRAIMNYTAKRLEQRAKAAAR